MVHSNLSGGQENNEAYELDRKRRKHDLIGEEDEQKEEMHLPFIKLSAELVSNA